MLLADKEKNLTLIKRRTMYLQKTPLFGCIGLLFVCLNTQALEYGGKINNTQWQISGSIFACHFTQTIPEYGKAEFYHQAGEDLSFRVYAKRNLMDYSYAQVSIVPASWRPSAASTSLGRVKVMRKEPQITLDAKRSNQFIHALLEGMRPTLTHYAYYDKSKFIRVQVSTVQFKRHYQGYMQCVNQLLPVNFEQVAKQKVFFKSGEEQIDAKDKQILKRVAFYVKKDPRVFAIYLDGHADNMGRRYENRQVSRKRVEDVERYLIKQGIDDDLITTRFHGERYPVASNHTATGRAANRRVTIRLERREDMPIPDELLFKPQATKTK